MRGRVRRRPGLSVLAGLLGLAAAYHAFTVTFDALFASRNPALASQVTSAPGALVRSWQIAAIRDPGNLGEPAIRNAALLAIADEPLNEEALRALAYHEDHLGNAAIAARFAGLSQEVTRRDEMNQLLLAQFAARDGQVPAAMDHLGTALTTSQRAREEVFALMVPLLPNAEFQAALASEISRENDWSIAFLEHALASPATNAIDLGAVLLAADPIEARAIAPRIGANLLSAVARRGDTEMVRALLRVQFPQKDGLLANPALSTRTAEPQVGWLGWTPVGGAASGAELGETDAGGFGVLAWTAGGQEETAVLRRVLQLPPGRYALSDVRDRQEDSRARFDWVIECHDGSRWRALPFERQNGVAGFVIDRDCAMQLIELRASSPRGGQGGEIVIGDFSVRRTGPAGQG